jgi:hypothetical protein
MVAALLAGCATEPPRAPPVEADDSRIHVALDTVVVRKSKDSWAHDAYWDEYRLRARSVSGNELQVSRIRVIDAFERPIEASTDVKNLIHASKEIQREYVERGKPVGRIEDSPYLAWHLPGAYPVGLLLFLPVLAVELTVGDPIRRAYQDGQLKRRQTPLPATIGHGDTAFVVFFPIVPRPSAVEISYREGEEEHRITLATQAALSSVHAPYRQPTPVFPMEARGRVNGGWVKANLSVDTNGAVIGVEVVEASSPYFIEEAKRTFARYRFESGESRVAAEVLWFGLRN